MAILLGNFSEPIVDNIAGINQVVKDTNQPFFVDLINLERLYFQNIPLTLEYDPNTSLIALPSFGANITNYQFTGAEDTLRFDMSWYGDSSNRKDVLLKTKWLEALSKDDGKGKGIHPLKLVFGDMYVDAKWVLKSAPTTFSLFNRKFGMLPQLALTKITLCKISETNPTRDYITKIGT